MKQNNRAPHRSPFFNLPNHSWRGLPILFLLLSGCVHHQTVVQVSLKDAPVGITLSAFNLKPRPMAECAIKEYEREIENAELEELQ